jgi:hypothetical protein
MKPVEMQRLFVSPSAHSNPGPSAMNEGEARTRMLGFAALLGAGWTRTHDLLRTAEDPGHGGESADLQGFQAADGTRTHDLLHGKKKLIRRYTSLFACKLSRFRPEGPGAEYPSIRADSGGFSEPFVGAA